MGALWINTPPLLVIAAESVMGSRFGMPFGRKLHKAPSCCRNSAIALALVKTSIRCADHKGSVFRLWRALIPEPCPRRTGLSSLRTVIDGKIYARAMDANPRTACTLQRDSEEGFRGRKFRLIMGLNEENGWRCMEYYSRHERMPDLGFSPDANFPVINREKGVLFVKCFFEVSDKNLTECGGGTRVNMVPDRAHFVYGGIRRDFKGISAHGSQPHKGENAIHKMMAHLKDLTANGAIHVIYELLCSEGFLGKLGMDLSDEVSGQLTINLGRLDFEGGKLIASLDIRYPVTFKKEEVLGMLEKALPASIEVINFHRPLYVPEDDELIKKLLAAYKKVTGKEG